MNNPVLLSEGFERAAIQHRIAMQEFSTDGFEEAVRLFSSSVEKFGRLLAMQAENDERKAVKQSMAYVEDDFLGALDS